MKVDSIVLTKSWEEEHQRFRQDIKINGIEVNNILGAIKTDKPVGLFTTLNPLAPRYHLSLLSKEGKEIKRVTVINQAIHDGTFWKHAKNKTVTNHLEDVLKAVADKVKRVILKTEAAKAISSAGF